VRLWISVFALSAALSGASPMVRQAVQSVDARPITLHVNVTDRDGRPVDGLTLDQFQVRDNGKPVPVLDFSTSPQPVTLMLLVDTSASMAQRFDAVIEAGSRFVEALRPGDRARIGGFAETFSVSAAFSSDRNQLLRALREELHQGNPTTLWDTLDAALTLLAGEPGRKVILAITDGVDTARGARADELLDRARRTEVTFHVIAPVNRYFDGRTNDWTHADPALRRLSTETGGVYSGVSANEELDRSFAAVLEALHNAYVLTFVPAEVDGRVHRVEVRVDKPRVRVRARQRYLATGIR